MHSRHLLVATLALAGSLAFASAAAATINIQLAADVTATLTNSGQNVGAVTGRLQRQLNAGLEELGRTNAAARALFASGQTIVIVCFGSEAANRAGLSPGDGLYPAPAETRGDFNADGSPRAGGTVVIAIYCDGLRQKGLDTPFLDIDPNSTLFRVLIHELFHASDRARNHQTDDQQIYNDFVEAFLAALKDRRVGALPLIGDGTFNGMLVAGGEDPRPANRLVFNFNAASVMGATDTTTTFGFEQTFLAGNASIGVRLPFLGGPGGVLVGDLTIIGKYLFRENPATGTVLSGGLALTLPLNGGGGGYLQPFVGWQTERQGFTIQGFASVLNPIGVAGNNIFVGSVGVGYPIDLAGGTHVQTVVPTFELHLNDPLGTPGFELNATFGAQFLLRGGASAHVGLTVPMGPFKPYDLMFAVGLDLPLDGNGFLGLLRNDPV